MFTKKTWEIREYYGTEKENLEMNAQQLEI